MSISAYNNYSLQGRPVILYGSPARNTRKAKVLLMKAWKKAVGALAMTTLVASMFTGCGKKDAAKDNGNEIKIGALFELTGLAVCTVGS